MATATKSRRTRKPMTEADKEAAQAAQKAKRETCDAMIQDGLSTLTDPEAWRTFLARQTTALGRLSFRNQMLVTMQCPGATDTAGYGDWITRGRQVRKGETGLLIFAPILGKFVEGKDGKEVRAPKGEDGTVKMCGVKVVATFDISQTDAIEGKPFKPSPHAVPIDLDKVRDEITDMAGEHAEAILAALDEAMAEDDEDQDEDD